MVDHMQELELRMKQDTARVNEMLLSLAVPDGSCQQIVLEAMRYSMEAGGKRIRPFLVLECCRMAGGTVTPGVLACACAVELVHTYSLIHDDLPCMDDDDLRRGRPSCHIQFGEDIALLAGDALLTLAFETIAGAELPAETRIQCILALSKAAGTGGMLGGQVIDLQSEGKQIGRALHERLCLLKTGALIRASGKLGALCAGAGEREMLAIDGCCRGIGLVFQIVDDILDESGDEAMLGKRPGSDAASEKNTFVSLYGLEAAEKMAEKLTEEAVGSLALFGSKGAYLEALAQMLLHRRS